MSEALDERPWRKRRPVLSRVLLFGSGALVVGVLLFLQQRRAREDELVRLRAEVSAFQILLTIDSGPDQVLRKVAEKLRGDDLPLDLQIAGHRYEAMALRRKVRMGRADAGASARINRAFERAHQLAADRETRNGILLEWAESELEAGDVAAARAALALGDFGGSGPWALLRDQYLAIGAAIELGPKAGAKYLEDMLAGWKAPLALEPRVEAGGRFWNLPQVATVTGERLARIYSVLGRDARPLWVRISALVANDAREQVICCKALIALEAQDEARLAWARALAADAQEARAWAASDPNLSALDVPRED